MIVFCLDSNNEIPEILDPLIYVKSRNIIVAHMYQNLVEHIKRSFEYVGLTEHDVYF